jgi:methionyl-tRNA formyltransferase
MEPVRVVAVTQSDPFFTSRFFEAFLEEARGTPVELVEIVLLRNFNESKLQLLRRLLGFYGQVDTLRILGRYVRARGRSVESVAAQHGVPVRTLTTVNDDAYLATLRKREVDVLLSVAAPELFHAAALDAAPRVLNVHNGRLPRYRGMMPTFWALHEGDEEVVVTVHEMAERLDAGRIVAEFLMPVEPGESAFDVSARAKVVAGREVARLLAAPWPEPRDAAAANGSYFTFPTRRDARELRARGRRLL